MILKKLYIERDEWGPQKGMLNGKIEYVGQYGDIGITLNPEHCKDILAIVADALVKTSRDMAANLTADVVASAGARLEDKSGE